ncbi:MAG: hypothetical protein AAF525_08320 [Pseudomonadota bacterium]
MRALKLLGWCLAVLAGLYVVFVVLFEAVFLGHYQPTLEQTGIPMLVITTKDADGNSDERRLARIEVDGRLYVSAHHWPRGWYRRATENPSVTVDIEGVAANYTAVVVEKGAEFDKVSAALPLGFVVRLLMGFPPEREILRLDPVG